MRNEQFRNALSQEIKRSKFNLSHSHKTTFNTGKLIPLMIQEVLPGDTFDGQLNYLIRKATMLSPTMDNAFIDTFFFFIPNRLLWENWTQFMGENTKNPWKNSEVKEIPQIRIINKSQELYLDSISNYFGLPNPKINTTYKVSALPFRAYNLVWNEFFRDQNLQDPLNIYTGDFDQNEIDVSANGINTGIGTLQEANKYHDYFTSALPEPQKGDDVNIPLSISTKENELPVYALEKTHEYTNRHGLTYEGIGPNKDNLDKTISKGNLRHLYIQADDNSPLDNVPDGHNLVTKTSQNFASGNDELPLAPNNLWTTTPKEDLASDITINEFREALLLQNLYEIDARGGTRYTELLESHFGVKNEDSRLQRPELLGSFSQLIENQQVAQSSGTTDISPQANLAAFSQTGHSSHAFTKSFTEHGVLIALAVVRTEQSYQNRIDKFFSKKDRVDFYFPALEGIGEQPILNKEIKYSGNENDDKVFGYQEAWAEYKYLPNKITGLFNSEVNQSLDSWHYANDFEQLPVLSHSFIKQDDKGMLRTLAVQDQAHFIGDFQINIVAIRPVPTKSIPASLAKNSVF